MNRSTGSPLHQFAFAKCDEAALLEAERKLQVEFPVDYARFLKDRGSGEGPVGRVGYLVLWRCSELIELNRAYGVAEYAPELVLFGSDGGDTAYAFDRRGVPASIVAVPFVPLRTADARPSPERSMSSCVLFLSASANHELAS